MKKNEKNSLGDVSSKDFISSISSLSGVTKAKRPGVLEKKIVWLIAGISLIIIGAILLTSGSKSKPTALTQSLSAGSSVDAESELADNLAQLNKMHQLIQSAQQADASSGVIVSKDYLVRQNAPTTLYSAMPFPSSIARAKSAASAKIFVGHDDYSSFGNQPSFSVAIHSKRIAHPRYTIASGEFIHAVLETAIDSDLPGLLRAIISEPVYAYTGEKVLIPAGSRLIGQYSSSIRQGINRIFVVWNRVVLPGGVTVQLDSPGVDAIGQAGQTADSVNTHFFARFSQAALLSIIGAGVSTLGVNSDDQFNSASAYRSAVAQAFQRSADQSLKSDSHMPPTLHVFQGASVNVFVAHDLDFYRDDHG